MANLKRIQYELYDPSLSVEDNAVVLGCSPATVRKFIRSRDIDRKFDAAYCRWKAVKDFNSKHPDSSYSEKRKVLGLSVNTIKKYEALSEEQVFRSKRDTNKISQFDIRNKNAIRSVSNNQTEILRWIIHLYNNDKTFEADLTASKLYFYKRVPKPVHLYDKYPQLDEVKNLSEADSLPEGVFTSIVYDLPFVISQGKTSIIRERFSHFHTVEELYGANDEMLDRAYRLLHNNGILVVKTMDVASMGKQYWVSDYVLAKAKEKGLELLDKFILVANVKLFCRTRAQHCSRKWHSYFFVFKKRN